MYQNDAHKQYTSVQISTVDRGRLLLMLYDGCINFLKHSKVGLESNDMGKFCKFLGKGQAIISELMMTLDFEKGGDIAKELDRLYEFMLFHLTYANLEKNGKKLQDVIDLVTTIANAYRDIIENGKATEYLADTARAAMNEPKKEPSKSSSSSEQPTAEEVHGKLSIAL